MRIPLCFKTNPAKISLLLLAVVISSCNTLKRVGDNQLLITKNTIYADSAKVSDEDIESLIIQNPNTDILGYPLRLNLYNLAKVNPDSSFHDWLYRKEKREQRLINLLSKKQVDRLGESFLVKGLSEWLKKIGEAPSILDTIQTRRTLERLGAYYGTKGYFNSTTTYEIDSSKRKRRAEVSYKVNLNQPYVVDSISHKISSSAIDSIYNLHRLKSHVKTGRQFDRDDFTRERERLDSIFTNSGIYNFQESSTTFDIVWDSTRMGTDKTMDVELKIEDLKKRDENTITTSEYKVFKFDKINIYSDYQFNEKDSVQQFIRYKDYTIFYNGKLRFKPKTLADAIFFQKDSIYRDLDKIRTYRQLSNLNVFRYPTITFEEDSTKTNLTAKVYLSARPKYSLAPNFEITRSNVRRLGIGIGTSFIIRNIFKGAENLSISADGSFGLLSNTSSTEKFFSEIGGEVNLNFPRIWFPLLNTDRIIPNYTTPRTRLSIGTSFQQNIGLDKQTFNSILGYNWTPSNFKKHNVELINVQFVRNVRPEQFFNVYSNTFRRLNEIATNEETRYFDNALVSDFYDPNTLNLTIPEGTTGFINAVENQGLIPTSDDDYIDVIRIEERRDRLTENNLIFTSNYTLNKTNRNGVTDNSFYQFRWKLESAGNLLSGLSYLIPFDENTDNELLVFGVPYSQYLKTEFDYIKYWDLRRSNILAFRSFFGIAVPYGNSNSVPFVRSYFAGGSNDNRAWYPYSLGPGKTQAINDFNEANLKIALNLEYRFPVVGDIYGALFADAGNIWNVFDNVDDPDATFNGFDSLADIALGTGFGLRYDFTYFLFRVDLGFKTYNPAEEPSKRWFRDYNFRKSVLQIGINYPF